MLVIQLVPNKCQSLCCCQTSVYPDTDFVTLKFLVFTLVQIFSKRCQIFLGI